MRPDDITLLAACGRPSLTPDGAGAVVAVGAPSLEHDRAVSSLWWVPTAGGPPRRITRGLRDTAPAVSPDGRWVAFLRAGPEDGRRGSAQLHLVEVAGGEPVRVTDDATHPLGAGAPVWSPDGRALAHVARVPEPGRYGTAEGVGPDAEPPRLITALPHRLDGVGHTRDRRPHVFVVTLDLDLESTLGAAPVPHGVSGASGASSPDGEVGEPGATPVWAASRQVTDGEHDDGDVVWTRDGAALLLTSNRHPGADTDHRRGLHLLPLATTGTAGTAEPAALRQVVGGHLHVEEAVAAPDGATVVLLASETGSDGLDVVARPTSLWSAPLDGSAPPIRLTGPELDLGDPADHLVLTDAGALVAERRRGGVRLLRVPLDGGDPEVLLDGHRQALACAATADGSCVVAVVADPHTPGDLVRLHGAAIVPLTDLAAPLRAAGVRPLREITASAPDGYPVHGWVVLPDPAQHGPGPHPSLLVVHGGPFSQYGWAVFDEAQVLAGAGYAVVMGNPRGSAGYGVAHGRAVVGSSAQAGGGAGGGLGTLDADDVLALLDGALADDALPLDAGRVGVMGGSYGGYMTALLTTRTDRFAAAIVERGYLDAVSFVGSSDIGWYFPRAYHGSVEAMVEQSPMTRVAAVTTPTLVIHSEQDWRCPVEQGQRWFTELKLRGIEAELLLFPGEGHELTRAGRPRHRVARFEHVLRWWGRHLPVS